MKSLLVDVSNRYKLLLEMQSEAIGVLRPGATLSASCTSKGLE